MLASSRKRAFAGKNRQLQLQRRRPARVSIIINLIIKLNEFRQRFFALRNLNLEAP